MKIVIIGAGTFGTALALSIDDQNDVILYSIESDVIHDINTIHRNIRYFPNRELPRNIRATGDFSEIHDAHIAFIAIPSNAVLDFFKTYHFNGSCLIVNGSKGFAKENQIITEALAIEAPQHRYAALKGPSFANELIFEIPTSFTIASHSETDYQTIQSLFRKNLIVTDYTRDIRGVEMLSIIKNVYAIAMGIVDAYYNSPNVRFLVFTKTINEIRKLMNLYQVENETLFCYCGIGDLGLTALNDLSRNRTLGLLIGKGFYDNVTNSHVVLEGMRSMDTILAKIPQDRQSEFPILCQMHDIVVNKISVKAFLNAIIF